MAWRSGGTARVVLVIAALALGLAVSSCTSPSSSTPAPPAAPATETMDERIGRAADGCLASGQPEDCQGSLRVLADLVIELADTAEVSVDFEKEMDEVREALQSRPISDPDLVASLEAAYRLVNENRDFEPPAEVPGRAELLEQIRARITAAREELRQNHPEACIRQLLGSMLLIQTPVRIAFQP